MCNQEWPTSRCQHGMQVWVGACLIVPADGSLMRLYSNTHAEGVHQHHHLVWWQVMQAERLAVKDWFFCVHITRFWYLHTSSFGNERTLMLTASGSLNSSTHHSCVSPGVRVVALQWHLMLPTCTEPKGKLPIPRADASFHPPPKHS